MKVVGVLQSRLTSSRLPGKTLLPIHGRPMLLRCWDRLAFCKRLDSIVVATSDDPANEPIRAVCAREGIGCVSATDNDRNVVGRLVEAAGAPSADAIVRITPDCPLVDYSLVDRIVEAWLRSPRFDYVSNVLPRTFPDGLDAELVTSECLKWIEAEMPHPGDTINGLTVEADYQEEPTRFIWDFARWFSVAPGVVNQGEEWGEPSGPITDLSALCWTVNHARDLEFVRWVYGQLPEGFRWTDVLRLDALGPWRDRLTILEPAVNPAHARRITR